MEADPPPHSSTRPMLRLQATSFSGYSAPSLSPSFKLDEGYSDDTRSQPDKETVSDDAMVLPDWVLSQNEADRAGTFRIGWSRLPSPTANSWPPSTTELAYSLLRSLTTSNLIAVIDRLNPLLHMDPVVKLPPELTFQVFSYLDTQTLLTASLASRSWRSRILDSGIWRVRYINEGWRADMHAIRNFEQEHAEAMSPLTRRARPQHSDPDLGEPKHKKRVLPTWFASRANKDGANGHTPTEADEEGDHHMTDGSDRRGSHSLSVTPSSLPRPPSVLIPPLKSALLLRCPDGTVKVNWLHLYKQRRRLEANWHHGRFTNFQLPHPSHPEEAHRECVYAIQFEGQWLVSGSRDKTVRVWDLETKRLWHRPLVGHSKSVLCLQFDPSPEEDIIISGSSDKSVIIWQFSTGKKIQQIQNAHSDSVLNLKFNHQYLVTCSKDRTVKIWNRQELTPLDESYPRVSNTSGASYPSYIVDLDDIAPSDLETSIANGHIKALRPYTHLMTVEGHGAAVNAMELRGDEIVTASGDRMIKVWNVRSGACLKTLMGHLKGIACVQFDSRRIVSGSNDNTVRIYDHISGAEVACLHGHNNLVRTVQAGFGDPPGADEALRLEAREVELEFIRAQEAGAPVELGPRALRRAGHHVNTAGSRDPRNISAIGAQIPPGGGGSQWARIVSGSYDESLVVWHKERDGAWKVGLRLQQEHALSNASRAGLSETAQATVSAQAQQLQAAHALTALPAGQGPAAAAAAAAATPDQNANDETPPANHAHNNAATNGSPPNAAVNQPPPAQAIAPAAAPQPLGPHMIAHGARRPASLPHSRVFKAQFDSRKIICASVDPRIVGWDFACEDEEILEACPFFQVL
ncbi:hypothetical protein N7532_008252 [Penicillium argentinense]|uniref:Probable E3 ubiquitin ligase complex SCF subunit sconB n=1 Tax=Penicillium argentinense TaxID=1131581 RepID=A0A9W9EX03_9EURO|nr:uncharacterized protein N7532_008252 [Penicillium argentinense]KAJ5089568.1 hypothetical protein N7532_008252 [Penicillium argentinense]